jgi:1-phosphofructokinase family hexose kinase
VITESRPDAVFVSPATSLDRYLRFADLTLGEVNRPSSVVELAGGKALNSARAAVRLGLSVATVALAGGYTGRRVIELARTEGWQSLWVQTEAVTRICSCFLDERTAAVTEAYEELSAVPAELWPAFGDAVERLICAGVPAVALSGRMPQAFVNDSLAALVRLARAQGVASYLDSTGPMLADAVAAGPSLVKLNSVEATGLAGVIVADVESALAACRRIKDLGASAVVITLGPDGAAAVDADTAEWTVAVPRNPRPMAVGSGDSFLAGLIAAQQHGDSFSAALRLAAGASLANTFYFTAGGFSMADV